MANYISKHTGKQIDAAVAAFLAGGGTGSVEVDTTLTKAGKAADAKATGDRLTALSEEKVDKQQGAKNASTLLYVNENGDVTPMEIGAFLSADKLPGVEETKKAVTLTAIHNKVLGRTGLVNDSGDSTYTISEPISVTPGEKLELSCSGYYWTSAYVFYDADGAFVSNYFAQTKVDGNGSHNVEGNYLLNEIVVVPENAATLRISWCQGTTKGAVYRVTTQGIGAGYCLNADIADLITGNDVVMLDCPATASKTLSTGGQVIDQTDSTYYVTDAIKVQPNTWYKITGSAGYGGAYYCIYDSSGNVIGSKKAPGGSGTCLVNKMVLMPASAATLRVAYMSTISGAAVVECRTVKARTTNRRFPWLNKFGAISYSTIGVAPINTLETYISAAHLGFNICKGDVQPTSDGKIVMCHDSGFTFDSNGRITAYDAENSTPIRNLTYGQCMAYEYEARSDSATMNHYAKVCDIDSYLDVCKQYGMVAFVTVRDAHIDEVVPELLARLEAHGMLDHAIINSYTPQTLSYVRALNDDIPLSFVRNNDEIISAARVDQIAAYGRCAITLVSTAPNMESYINGLADVLAYARKSGIGIMYSQPTTFAQVNFLRNAGICAAQIGAPIMPYTYTQARFRLSIASGAATLVEWYNANSIDADVTVSGNTVSVTNIADAGSARGFADRVLDLWMNRLPHRITAESASGNTVSAKWVNNALQVTVSDISESDTIDIMLEV